MERNELLKHLEEETKVLKDPLVKRAFTFVDRANFLHEDYKSEAYEDYALPLTVRRSMLQPTRLAFMLELLHVKEGMRVLLVGMGTGWTAALLATMVGEKGEVVGIEEDGELALLAIEAFRNPPFDIIRSVIGKWRQEVPKEKAFDRIIIEGSVEEIPPQLLPKLKEGGILVLFVGQSLTQVTLGKNGKVLQKREFPDFISNACAL